MTSVGKKMVKSVRWSALEKGGQQGITFIVFAVLARFIAPEDFGLVAIALIIIGFIQIFIDQGFSTAIIQREAVNDEFLSTAFWTHIGVGVVLSLVLIALKGVPAWIFSEPRLAELIPWMALALLIEALMGVPQALLKRNFDFKGLAVRTIAARLIAGTIAITSAVAGWGVWSLVLFTVMSNALSTAILWWISDWYPKFRFSSQCFKDLLGFGGNVAGVRIMAYVNTRILDVLIGYFFGAAALGYYTLAFQLVGRVSSVIVQVLSQVTMSGFSRVQTSTENLLEHLLKVTRLTTALVFPLFALLALMSGDLVTLLYGHRWEHSAMLISIMAPIGPARVMISSLGNMVMSAGKPNLVLRARAFSTIIVVVVLLSMVRLGSEAMIVAFTLSFYVVLFPLNILVVKKIIPFQIGKYARQETPILLATLTLMLTVFIMHTLLAPYEIHPLGMVLMTMSVSLSSYVITLRVLDSRTIGELRRVFLGATA